MKENIYEYELQIVKLNQNFTSTTYRQFSSF